MRNHKPIKVGMLAWALLFFSLIADPSGNGQAIFAIPWATVLCFGAVNLFRYKQQEVPVSKLSESKEKFWGLQLLLSSMAFMGYINHDLEKLIQF